MNTKNSVVWDDASRCIGMHSANITGLFCFLIVILLQFNTLRTATAAEENPQAESAGIGVLARIHFNTQTRNFERTREFYRLLGYSQGINSFPKTNTHLMARSLGMYDLCTYELESIEVMSIPNATGTTSIDLIQFAVPFNSEAPYSLPNHLGMAYAALNTANFSSDYEFLRQRGVEFLSEPYGEPGERFVFMRDPDGVYLKLLEAKEATNAPVRNDSSVSIDAMPYIGINVSDFDAAIGFYRSLGYTEIAMLPERGTLAEARAYGLEQAFELRGADISLADGDGNTLRIIQWIAPFNPEPPYPPPISHIGIHRIALAVQDLDSAVSELQSQGVEFLSEIAPCCSGTGVDETGIINALDPDGIFVELVGPIRRRPQQPEPAICAEENATAHWYRNAETLSARLNI